MSAVISASPPAVDLAAVKGRQQAAWSAGDYAVVGTTLQIVGETLAEAADIRAGEAVLDVAAGTGLVTRELLARGFRVTSLDQSPEMLAVARRHADSVASGGQRMADAPADETAPPKNANLGDWHDLRRTTAPDAAKAATVRPRPAAGRSTPTRAPRYLAPRRRPATAPPRPGAA